MNAYSEAKVRVGCFTALSVTVFVGFLFWIAGGDASAILGRERDKYVVTFTDVTGLRARAPVTIAGKVVGEVTGTRLVEGAKADVAMEIDRGVAIYSNARFIIVKPALIGTVSITIEPGEPAGGATLISVNPGDSTEAAEIKSTRRMNIPVTQSQSGSGLDTVMAQSAKTVELINNVLIDFHSRQDELMGRISELVGSTGQLMEKVNRGIDEERVRAIIDNVAAVSDDVRAMINENREQLKALLGNVDGTVVAAREQMVARSEEVGELLRKVTASLDERISPLLNSLERLTDSLTRIVGDSSTNVHETIRNLRATTENLQGFTARIKANPSLILFGDDEKKAERDAATGRMASDLRERGRLPIYDKRDQ